MTWSCTLHNIGVGPAIDLYSFIQNPDSKKQQRYDFGTLSKGDKTPGMHLMMINVASDMMLVAFYYDVYGNLLSSSRKVTINQQKKYIVHNLSNEPIKLIEENNIQ